MTDVTDTIQPDTTTSSDAASASDDAPVAEVQAFSPEVQDKLVPVTEAIRYRKRAQAAEQQLNELNQRLETLHGELSEARQTVEHLERRQHIDAMLADADAIDLDTARLLTERAVEQMSDPDVQLAVDDLRRTKPYLFRQRKAEGGGAMTARSDHLGEPTMDAEHAAERAVSTGDRRDLLHYLRLRRRA